MPIVIHHGPPGTRGARPIWACEELGIPYINASGTNPYYNGRNINIEEFYHTLHRQGIGAADPEGWELILRVAEEGLAAEDVGVAILSGGGVSFTCRVCADRRREGRRHRLPAQRRLGRGRRDERRDEGAHRRRARTAMTGTAPPTPPQPAQCTHRCCQSRMRRSACGAA